MRDWLARHYGWQAKRAEWVWLGIVAAVLVLAVTIGPAVVSLIEGL